MTADNFLVSSAGRRGHLVALLREALEVTGGGEVVACDASPLSAAGLLADRFEVVPRVTDPNFIDHMVALCERHQVAVLVPTIDPELPVYSGARERFAAVGCAVWVSSPEVVALGTDKWYFHEWLRERGLSSPETYEAHDERASTISGPVIAKPRSGSSSIGLMRAESVDALDLATLSPDYLVQRAVSGFEVTIDFAVDRDGRVLGTGARRRLEVRAGEVSKAVTVDHAALRQLIDRFIRELPGAYGVLNVQVIVDDESGTITFLELNPRFGGGYPLTWQAGGKFPLALLGEGPGPRQDAAPGLYMLRYDAAVFADSARLPGMLT